MRSCQSEKQEVWCVHAGRYGDQKSILEIEEKQALLDFDSGEAKIVEESTERGRQRQMGSISRRTIDANPMVHLLVGWNFE